MGVFQWLEEKELEIDLKMVQSEIGRLENELFYLKRMRLDLETKKERIEKCNTGKAQ
jgi:hypothetical protein